MKEGSEREGTRDSYRFTRSAYIQFTQRPPLPILINHTHVGRFQYHTQLHFFHHLEYQDRNMQSPWPGAPFLSNFFSICLYDGVAC